MVMVSVLVKEEEEEEEEAVFSHESITNGASSQQ